jgi:hypothetical protein
VWFWLLISVAADLFRRYGWIKAIGVLAYLIFQGRGMAERNVQQAQQARDESDAWLVLALPMKSRSSID